MNTLPDNTQPVAANEPGKSGGTGSVEWQLRSLREQLRKLSQQQRDTFAELGHYAYQAFQEKTDDAHFRTECETISALQRAISDLQQQIANLDHRPSPVSMSDQPEKASGAPVKKTILPLLYNFRAMGVTYQWLCITFTAVIVIVLLSASLWIRFMPAKVPSLVGLPEPVAKREGKRHFTWRVAARNYSNTVPAGRIIRQQPRAGERMPRAATLSVWISRGASAVVPELIGLDEQQAKKLVRERELRYKAVGTAPHPTLSSGAIMSQFPLSGTNVKPNSLIQTIVSSGSDAPLIRVPNVQRLPKWRAKQLIEHAGFQYSERVGFHATVPKGKVISQDPAPRALRAMNTVVIVRISKGMKEKQDSQKYARIRIHTRRLPAGKYNRHYVTKLSASGGRPPYTWSVVGLPAGLTAHGPKIVGHCKSSGAYRVIVRIRDKNASKISQEYQLRVAAIRVG